MTRQQNKVLDCNQPRHMGLLERSVMWRVIAVQSCIDRQKALNHGQKDSTLSVR